MVAIQEPTGALALHENEGPDDGVGTRERAGMIDRYEDATLALDIPQVDIPAIHNFSAGIYSRHVVIPAGVLITGRKHRHSHLVMIAHGRVTIWDEQHGTQNLVGFTVFESKPGARRMIYAHEETIFITLHATNETDIEKVEEEIYFPSEVVDELKRRRAVAALNQGEPKP